jgi:excisionase family DNA binding protein
MAASDDATLTIGEAARLCGIAPATLRRAVARGDIGAWHTPGNHLRFSRNACLAFARSLGIDLVLRPPQPAVGRSDGAGVDTPAAPETVLS